MISYLQELTQNITILPCQSGWIHDLLPTGTHTKHHNPSPSIRLDTRSPTYRNSHKISQSIPVNQAGYTISYLQELTQNITIHPRQSGWIHDLLPAGTHTKHHNPFPSIRLDTRSPTCRNSHKTSQSIPINQAGYTISYLQELTKTSQYILKTESLIDDNVDGLLSDSLIQQLYV